MGGEKRREREHLYLKDLLFNATPEIDVCESNPCKISGSMSVLMNLRPLFYSW